jgi:hypothetical protein
MCSVTPEQVKDIAETIALASAAGFFIYKAVSGYLYVDMSLAVSSQRSSANQDEDLLAITAHLKKGSRGSVRIHDAQARVTFDGGQQTMPFAGFHRLSYTTDRTGSVDRKVLDWSKRSETQPLLRLPPDEATEFSCCFRVPKHVICVVEVAVLGRERSWFRLGQWRASHVSTPKPNQSPAANRRSV